MNKALLFVLSLLCANSAFAKLPEGVWVSQSLVDDDGGYGSYYRGWYYISETSVDYLITLGAHYNKQKLKIQEDDGTTVKLWDTKEKTLTEFAYTVNGDVLNVCNAANRCREFKRTDERPAPDIPPLTAPEIKLIGKWCVESDCEEIAYSREQSLFICNLNSDFRPYFSRYRAPDALLAKYKMNLDVLMYPYRLDNQNNLSSYSVSMYLQSTNGIPTTLSQSGVKLLQSGPFSTMNGVLQGHNITVEFSIIQ